MKHTDVEGGPEKEVGQRGQKGIKKDDSRVGRSSEDCETRSEERFRLR